VRHKIIKSNNFLLFHTFYNFFLKSLLKFVLFKSEVLIALSDLLALQVIDPKLPHLIAGHALV